MNKKIASVSLKLSVIVCVYLLMFQLKAYSQSLDYGANKGSELTEDAVQGIENVTASIISDSFTPMTHYSKGDYVFSLVPAYFEVNRLFDESELEGDDLNGYALGFGGGYALSDRFMLYGIFAGLNMEGDIYSEEFPDYKAGAEYSMYAFLAGLGFDIIDLSGWSVPLYLGLCVQRYDAEIIPPSFSFSSLTAEVKVTGSGLLYGPTAGIAVSKELFSILRVTPYFLMLWNMNKPELTAEATARVPPFFEYKDKYKLEMEEVRTSMFGLNITYLSTESLSFSVSAGGLISSGTNYYNEKFLGGLDMMSIVIAISYSGGISQAK